MTVPGSPRLGWCQAEVAAECPFGPRKALPLCPWGTCPPHCPPLPVLARTETGLPNDTLGGSECVTQLLWVVRAPPVASCFWGALGPLETAPGPVRGHHALLEPDDRGLRRAGLCLHPGAEAEAEAELAGSVLGDCGRGSQGHPSARMWGCRRVLWSPGDAQTPAVPQSWAC